MATADTFLAIQELIQPHKIQPCVDSTISVRELDRRATLKAVNIVSVGAAAFAVKYDESGFPGRVLFGDKHNLHRGCDSVAFCEVDNEPYILCMELKSSEPTRADVTEQFNSAHCFLDYLDTLITHYRKADSIKDWPRRYFVFHNQGATPLRKTGSRETFDNIAPHSAKFIPTQSGEKIYARKLLGKPI